MIVYRITSLRDGKRYIGITTGPLRKRWREHVCAARDGQMPLYRAMRRHGIENFAIEPIYEASSIAELKAVERGLICAYGTLAPRGYNVSLGGDDMSFVAQRGEAAHQAILTEAAIAFIRAPARAGVTNREMVDLVARELGIAVKRDTLRDARRGDHWQHLNKQYPPIKRRQGARPSRPVSQEVKDRLTFYREKNADLHAARLRTNKIAAKLTVEQVEAIRIDPRSHRVIGAEYGIDHTTVGLIKRGKTWISNKGA